MVPMRQLYATEKLAVIAGIGLPAAEEAPLSHFNGWSDWSTGKIKSTPRHCRPAGSARSLACRPSGPSASVAGARTRAPAGDGVGMPRLRRQSGEFQLQIPYYIPQFQLGEAYQKMLDRADQRGRAPGQAVTNATSTRSAPMQSYAQLAVDYPTQLQIWASNFTSSRK